MIYIGIDPSINCSGLTIFKNNKYYFYYHNTNKVTKSKKISDNKFLFNFNVDETLSNDIFYVGDDDFINTLKYDKISDKIVDIIKSYIKDENFMIFAIEGYAYRAMGRVFDLAELAGMIKIKVSKLNINKKLLAFKPQDVKKFATGKGNAKKELMLKTFRELNTKDTNMLLDLFNINNNEYVKNCKSPVEDLVDSYFIMKKGMVLGR